MFCTHKHLHCCTRIHISMLGDNLSWCILMENNFKIWNKMFLDMIRVHTFYAHLYTETNIESQSRINYQLTWVRSQSGLTTYKNSFLFWPIQYQFPYKFRETKDMSRFCLAFFLVYLSTTVSCLPQDNPTGKCQHKKLVKLGNFIFGCLVLGRLKYPYQKVSLDRDDRQLDLLGFPLGFGVGTFIGNLLFTTSTTTTTTTTTTTAAPSAGPASAPASSPAAAPATAPTETYPSPMSLSH